MQYRSPPVSRGPSSNTCPRWLSPCTERTSVRIIPCDESRTPLTCAGTIGVLKLGQPQPDPNFDDDANSGPPETTSTDRKSTPPNPTPQRPTPPPPPAPHKPPP